MTSAQLEKGNALQKKIADAKIAVENLSCTDARAHGSNISVSKTQENGYVETIYWPTRYIDFNVMRVLALQKATEDLQRLEKEYAAL